MSSFLADLAAYYIAEGKSVLVLTSNTRKSDDFRATVVSQSKLRGVDWFEDSINFHCWPIKQLDMFEGSFDVAIIDEMSALSFSNETNFINQVMVQCHHLIFASVPAQEHGLFYRLWTDESAPFNKIELPWTKSLLKEDSEEVAKRIGTLRSSLGNKRFENQFECKFRPVS